MAATILTVSIGLAVLLLTIMEIFQSRSNPPIKMLGSLMVLALAFAANNIAVYALGIFIIATLVTELDFLEKVAALFWNREKYWEYRLKKALPTEVAAKRKAEIKEEIAAEESDQATIEEVPERVQKTRRIDQAIQRALEFEKSVIDSLSAGKGPFGPAIFKSELKVIDSFGNSQIYDAIIQTPGTHYVVEVIYGERPSTLINAMNRLNLSLQIYINFLRERRICTKIVPVAIIPSNINAPNVFHDWLVVLKYNLDSHQFINEKEFKEAVKKIKIES